MRALAKASKWLLTLGTHLWSLRIASNAEKPDKFHQMCPATCAWSQPGANLCPVFWDSWTWIAKVDLEVLKLALDLGCSNDNLFRCRFSDHSNHDCMSSVNKTMAHLKTCPVCTNTYTHVLTAATSYAVSMAKFWAPIMQCTKLSRFTFKMCIPKP